MTNESEDRDGFRNTDTAEVRIRAALAEELAEPAVIDQTRPAPPALPPSRDSFRRSRRTRRWRRRAGVGFMMVGVSLMVLGSIFVLSEQTTEPSDPVGVEGVTTIRDATVPTSDPAAPFAIERTDPTDTIDPTAIDPAQDLPLPTGPTPTAAAPTTPPKPTTTKKPSKSATTTAPVRVG